MKQYKLIGFITVTGWYGGRGYAHLIITTTEEGLKRIKEDPLQDYISYGVKSIDYCYFDVYEIIKSKRGKYIITKETVEPIETIEKGEYDLDINEEEIWETEPIKINY